VCHALIFRASCAVRGGNSKLPVYMTFLPSSFVLILFSTNPRKGQYL
jgi:hypothetical protein